MNTNVNANVNSCDAKRFSENGPLLNMKGTVQHDDEDNNNPRVPGAAVVQKSSVVAISIGTHMDGKKRDININVVGNNDRTMFHTHPL